MSNDIHISGAGEDGADTAEGHIRGLPDEGAKVEEDADTAEGHRFMQLDGAEAGVFHDAPPEGEAHSY